MTTDFDNETVQATPENWPWTDPIKHDFHVAVYADKYPVSPGHRLYVPKYQTSMILCQAMEDAYRDGRQMVREGKCQGFNIGLNYGESAGQTVSWPHIHLIPRYTGDVEDATGGIRNVIPGKGNYKNASTST